MKFRLITTKQKFRHLGYREQTLPIVEKAMADFLLRMSVNSSYIVLGMYDIATEGFYKHNISAFLDQIPKCLSLPDDFSPYIKPYISDKFSNLVYSDCHELIIASFYKYYSIRLPVLTRFGRFVDWPKSKGVSEHDLKNITTYSLTQFAVYFHAAAEKLMANGPEDKDGIFYQYAVGKEIAFKYTLEDEKLSEFLYENEDVWNDIVNALPKMQESNIFYFIEKFFKSNFRIFWDSYKLDYIDQLRYWSIFGAFDGDGRSLDHSFWTNLENELDRHEFILKTAEPYD